MENILSLQTVLEKKNEYNLAIPFVESRQVNPYYKMSVSLLTVDTREQAEEIFKVGSKCIKGRNGDEWIDLFSLAKPFLQRLANEAGIQFAPDTGDVVKIDNNTWKASAYGALKLPDGTVRTSNNFKIIDLQTVEKKYRMAYEDRAEYGIEDYKMAKAASGKYKGEWVNTGKVDDRNYPIRKYVIDVNERGKYIERSLLDAMTKLRESAPQKAATGAILRVIRDLVGVKGTYTMEELRKPFAIARMSFSPDYNDPIVKQMMLQQALQSVGNLFGNVQPVVQTISIPQSVDLDDEDDEIDIPAEVDVVPPQQEQKEVPKSQPLEDMKPQQKTSRELTEDDRALDFCCEKCGKIIPEKVWNYSVENLGTPLCFNCQKIVRSEQRKGKR